MSLDKDTLKQRLAAGSHYPMRCVCCFRDIRPEEILFRWDDKTETAESRRSIQERKSGHPAQEFDDGTEDEEFWGNESTADHETKEYYDLEELAGSFDVTNIMVRNAANGSRVSLQQGAVPYNVTVREGDREYNLSQHYCPYCRNLLPASSGTIPTYYVTLLGPSNSGKTVFLCALYQALTHHPTPLPCGGILNGNADPSYNFVQNLSQKMYQGYLPDTTVDVFSKPIVLQLNYINNKVDPNLNFGCLLALSDMKGETFHNIAFQRDQAALANQYQKADGFLFFADPEITAAYQRSVAPGGGDGGETVANMEQIISQNLLILYENNRIDKPSVIFLTKVDVLLNRLRQYMPNFPWTSQRKEPEVSQRGYAYYSGINQETQKLLKALDSELYSFLEQAFVKKYYTTVAALGFAPRLNEKGRVEQGITLNTSIRLQQPIVVLLCMLGFLPPYWSWKPIPHRASDLNKKEEKLQEQQIADVKKYNYQQFKNWKDTYQVS